MKLKRPKITDGTWRLNEESNQVFGGIECIASGPPLPLLDHERANFTAIAALPKVMDLLEVIVTKAVRYAEDPKGQTRALWQIEDMAKEALLKMGYTEEKEDDVCDECGREIPIANGGGLLNRHHAQSCSLYDTFLP